jgi:ketosteroid isomerase-like protein
MPVLTGKTGCDDACDGLVFLDGPGTCTGCDTDTTIRMTASLAATTDGATFCVPGEASTRSEQPALTITAAVEQFYTAVDQRDYELLTKVVKVDFQALFAGGCALVSGAQYCGSTAMDLKDFTELLKDFSPVTEAARVLMPELGNGGDSGVVAHHYTAHEGMPEQRNGACIFKVEDGLIHQIVFYADSNSRERFVTQFYAAVDEKKLGDINSLVDRTSEDTGKFMAVFGAGAAKVGGAMIQPDTTRSMNLEEFKGFIAESPARCNDGVCPTVTEAGYVTRKLAGNGNTVVDSYQTWTNEVTGTRSTDCEQPGCYKGVAIHNFFEDKIIESYWYSENTDNLCNTGGKLRTARNFFAALHSITLQRVNETLGQMQTRVDTSFEEKMSPYIYTHEQTPQFVAILSQGSHTVGAIRRDTPAGAVEIYVVKCLTAGSADARAVEGDAQDPSAGIMNYASKSTCEETGAQIKDFITLLIHGDRTSETIGLLECSPQITPKINCVSRTYTPEGDVIGVHYIARDDKGAVSEAGAVLLTFDGEKISEAYWFSDSDVTGLSVGRCAFNERVVNGFCETCPEGETSRNRDLPSADPNSVNYNTVCV